MAVLAAREDRLPVHRVPVIAHTLDVKPAVERLTVLELAGRVTVTLAVVHGLHCRTVFRPHCNGDGSKYNFINPHMIFLTF